MNIKIQIVFQPDDNQESLVEDAACLQRGNLLPETLGLTLQEGKDLLAKIQKKMVTLQIQDCISQNSRCPYCRTEHSRKGTHTIKFRTLFGSMELESPRFYSCS